MKHVDPASTAFLALSSREQARIYAEFYGWKPDAIADEYGITEDLAEQWITDARDRAYFKHLEKKKRLRAALGARPRKVITDELIAEIQRRYAAGEKTVSIVRALGVGERTVNRYTEDLRRAAA